MSCNGCRVLRKGCSESCILRPCLQWIDGPEAQANATLFVAKFFGRSDLMSFISAVPDQQKPALFQSLLFEACGRTVNPVNGAVGLLSTGNWHVCQAAVETVLSGGILRPIPGILAGNLTPDSDESSEAFCTEAWKTRDAYSPSNPRMRFEKDGEAADLSLSVTPRFSTKVTARRGKRSTTSFNTDQSSVGTSFEYGGGNREDRKVLDLFV